MNRLEPQQVEKLQELSTQLRQQRESQDITLEQLAARTHIPLRLLRALDAGQPEQLPEPIFIQGFIRRYGEAVGLDGKALAQQFPTEVVPPPPDPAEAEPETVEKPAIAPVDWQRPATLVGGAILGIGLLVWGVTTLLSRPKPAPVARSTSAVATTKTTKPAVPSSQTAASPSPLPKASPTANPVEAVVNLTQESWVQVTVDGKSAFEGTLPQGSKKTWVAKQQITLLAGNAGGVVVSVNRSQAKPLGKVGEVKEVTLTPKSVSSQATRL